VSDAIDVRAVSKAFPPPGSGWRQRSDEPAALCDVSLSVAFGEAVGLMGPNGAGKTTLLEVVATLIEPTTGSVHVCGADVRRRPSAVRRLLAYSGAVGQGFYARLPAAWNLEFFGVLNDIPRADARRLTAEWLARVGLAHAGAVPVERFSEGMRQRLGLARALMSDPSVLLLDEPTRSMDPAFRQTVHELLRRWCDQRPRRAILMVTHDVEEAEAVCDRVCTLDRGRLAGPRRTPERSLVGLR
jgi:ABC-2 type transport system ATP-binding protein